jgi:hypothetical protein
MHAACQQRVERGEEPGELLGQQDPALAVAEVLDAVLVGLGTEVFGEPLLQPVRRVDDQRFERVLRCGESGDGALISSQDETASRRITSRWWVPPSVSRKTASGVRLASVDLPTPSGP